jgi:hypothetical protein
MKWRKILKFYETKNQELLRKIKNKTKLLNNNNDTDGEYVYNKYSTDVILETS